MENERNCTCLYISYHRQHLFLWILKAEKPIRFRKVDIYDCFSEKGRKVEVLDLFANETFRKLHFLPEKDEQCKDRSWFLLNDDDSTPKSSGEHDTLDFRLMNEEENQQRDRTFADFYRMIIAPVADLLDEGEIIIVPDRFLFKVPFSALVDESEKYLSETFRILIVPSLTTLKLIQDCPVDYHNQTGALVVGDPYVGEVCYNREVYTPRRLPFAREEAEMIGRLLGAHTLLGEEAMKEAVLQRISSVSLIHFAAHGNDERGENLCFSGTNQKPERRRPFGTGLVRHCPQGLFSPFFTFLRALFFRAFRLPSPPLSAPGSPRMVDYLNCRCNCAKTEPKALNIQCTLDKDTFGSNCDSWHMCISHQLF